ncbi:MAG: DUF927 domain-containing protein [Ruminococcus sp.]|nr:DUF927 domain-containing protein [Ruminococcus sp.]
MEPLDRLDKQSILEEKVFEELFSQEDEIKKARLMVALEDRASELGVKTKFNTVLRAYKKVDKEMQKKQSSAPSILDNWTNFDGPYDRMYCGSWIASDEGVYSQNTGTADILACRHPIIPIERLKNLETGDEQMKIAYKRKGKWFEVIVPKDILSSANKVTSLYRRGISVTSENARCLVKYLQDIEDLNDEHINIQYSTSKLGWIMNGFVPYDKEVLFDGDAQFRQVFESIQGHGSKAAWYAYVKNLRKTGRLEIKFMLAASFASVLLHIVSGLPFFVDLWGETEGGKSVTLALAASVWANPEENAYIKDYKGTAVGLEVACDLLNHLPLMLDDTSKKDRRIEENFEGLVYDLCSGKGKTRSNKELGIVQEKHWKNVILTNGERPLNSYVTQGGAINRILELECGKDVYQDPQETIRFIRDNYGFAGKDFVDTIKRLGKDKIRQIQQELQRQIYDDEKMQKQSASLSIVLTADRIVTDYLFQDGEYIDIESAKEVLIDRNELSDNERCYQYILGEVVINGAKFDPITQTSEKWGVIEDGYAIIYNNAFDAICKKGGFSKKAFLSWADKKGLIQTQGGQLTKVKKLGGNPVRCVFIKLDDTIDSEGFRVIDDTQEKLPFS